MASIHVLALADIISGDANKQLTWLQSNGLMPQSKACPAYIWTCNHEITSVTNIGTAKQCSCLGCLENCRWKCPMYTCRKSLALPDGTFLERSRITLKQWIVLYWWARQHISLLLMLGTTWQECAHCSCQPLL